MTTVINKFQRLLGLKINEKYRHLVKIPKEEKPELAQKFSAAVLSILDGEGVKYKPDVVAQLVVKYFPDFRRVLNELQKHSIGGTIDPNVLKSSSNENFDELIGFLKKKDFTPMRKWVAQNRFHQRRDSGEGVVSHPSPVQSRIE